MRIDVAYCVELNRVVDIQDACQEFAAQNEATEFHFLCSDPKCRNSKTDGVRVTGVNHYKLPEEGKVFKSPHYRKLDEHIATCDWMELTAALKAAELSSDDDEDNELQASSDKHRKLQHILTRLIKRFVIPPVDTEGGTSNEICGELERIRNLGDQQSRRKELLAYARGVGSTATSLEALVSCYEELKNEDALNEEFTVDGYGAISFRNAFRQVGLGPTGGFVVYHGGARLYKRYGDGFALNFMDKIQENIGDKVSRIPVSFYVSQDNLKKYRPSARLRRMVDELVKNADRKPYLKVYWIGRLENNDKGYSAIFTTLAHVVMRLVYPSDKPTAPVQTLESLE
jgi:hypothetical protein